MDRDEIAARRQARDQAVGQVAGAFDTRAPAHARGNALTKELKEEALEVSALPATTKKRRWGRKASDVAIAAGSLSDAEWPVPGLFGPGLTLLFAAPKTGKTIMLNDIGWNVASGNVALGQLMTHQGDVLMVLSETTEGSLAHDIWEPGFPNEDPPDLLTVLTLEDWGAALREGVRLRDVMDEWRESASSPSLVVIDNLNACVGPSHKNDPNKGLQENERRMLTPIHSWAWSNNIAVVLIHHTNKMKIDKNVDWQTLAAGTGGITQVPDNLMMLGPGDEGAMNLRYKGRSLGRERSWDLVWKANRLTMFDHVEVTARTGLKTRQVLSGLVDTPSGAGRGTPAEVAEATGLPLNTVQQYLHRAAAKGVIEKVGHGLYQLKGEGVA